MAFCAFAQFLFSGPPGWFRRKGDFSRLAIGARAESRRCLRSRFARAADARSPASAPGTFRGCCLRGPNSRPGQADTGRALDRDICDAPPVAGALPDASRAKDGPQEGADPDRIRITPRSRCWKGGGGGDHAGREDPGPKNDRGSLESGRHDAAGSLETQPAGARGIRKAGLRFAEIGI